MPALPPQLEVRPIPPFDAVVRIPGSKSLTNRALLLAALADGTSTLTNVLFADDTRRMMEALRALGVELEIDEPSATATVHGCGGVWPIKEADLFLGNAGTAMRFLTAACCLGPNGSRYRLYGIPRMHERPIDELVAPLRQLGANISYDGAEGYPPLTVRGAKLWGGALEMSPTLSSQFISALMQTAPYMASPLVLNFNGPITSQPYVQMTGAVVNCFAGRSRFINDSFTVENCGLKGCVYGVEPDASNASYFLAAAAAVAESNIKMEGLTASSIQGDQSIFRYFAAMRAGTHYDIDGCMMINSPTESRLRGIDADLNDIPDAAMTIATLAVLAQGPTTIRNVGNWRVKETDRMEAMRVELTKLGATVEVDGDDITITPSADGRIVPAAIDTYDDHRMAMSFAVVGLAQPGVVINDPACVNKTFPTFWQTLNTLGPAVDLPADSACNACTDAGAGPAKA